MAFIDQVNEFEPLPENVQWFENAANIVDVADFEDGFDYLPLTVDAGNIDHYMFHALGALGYTGNINDRLKQYYQAGGATSGNIADCQRQFLIAQGATPSHVNNMWFELLGGAGYTGSLMDRLKNFWRDGGTFGPPPPPSPPTNWTALPNGLNSAQLINSDIIGVDTDGDGVWVAVGFAGGATRSTDNALTWSGLVAGLSSGQTANFQCVKTDRNGVWVAAGDNGMAARSIDNGATWSALPIGLNTGGGAVRIYNLETDRAGVWIAVTENGWASRSTDNGATWSALPQGLSTGNTSAGVRRLTTDRNGIWLFTTFTQSDWCARSIDNGLNWTPLTISNATPESPRGVANNTAGRFIVTCATGFAFASNDSAATWATLSPRGLNGGSPLSAPLEALATDEQGNWCVAGGSGKISYSSDDGVSFLGTTTNTGATTTIRRMATDNKGVWVCVFNGGFAARAA